LQLATLYPDHEHAVVNSAQHLLKHPTDYQQFQQVPVSPDRLHNSPLPYHHLSTAENLNRPYSDKKLHNGRMTDEVLLNSVCHCHQFMEYSHMPYKPDITDKLDMEETYYEVCRRNSLPTRNGQVLTDQMVVSSQEGGVIPLQNLAVQVGFGRNHPY
jgi:hypothetical protein